MKDRIFEVMKWTGQNLSQFADAIQVSPALLSSVKSERTKPTLLLLENIKRVYPEVDINWLITGEGNMLVDADGLAFATEKKEEKQDFAEPAKEESQSHAAKEVRKPDATEDVRTDKREDVSIETKQTEEPQHPSEKNELKRSVKQVLLMYNDGTYESFEK